MYSYAWLYEAFDKVQGERARAEDEKGRPQNALQAFLQRNTAGGAKDGFARIQECRVALDTMDRMGWQRSFHQRMFHDNFIRACARIFFKTDGAGAFARAHQSILDLNGWDNLSQEVLISTPRRFGKTISVSMFAAALVFSARSVEISIYSTCKRISQKLLRNVQKFLKLIYAGMKTRPFKELRCNMEEVVLQGPEGPTDVRIVNSYPSKVQPEQPAARSREAANRKQPAAQSPSRESDAVGVDGALAPVAHVDVVVGGDGGAGLDALEPDGAACEGGEAQAVHRGADVVDRGEGEASVCAGDGDVEAQGGAEVLPEGGGGDAVAVRGGGLEGVEGRGQGAVDPDGVVGVGGVVEGPVALDVAKGGRAIRDGGGGQGRLPEGGEDVAAGHGRREDLLHLLLQAGEDGVALLRGLPEHVRGDREGDGGGVREPHDGGAEERPAARGEPRGRGGVEGDAADGARAGAEARVEGGDVKGAAEEGGVVALEMGQDGGVLAAAHELMQVLPQDGEEVGEGEGLVGAVLQADGDVLGVARGRRQVGRDVGGALDGHVDPAAVGPPAARDDGAVAAEGRGGVLGALGVLGPLGGDHGEGDGPITLGQGPTQAVEQPAHDRVVGAGDVGEERVGGRDLVQPRARAAFWRMAQAMFSQSSLMTLKDPLSSRPLARRF
jgi:hypothetical protein